MLSRVMASDSWINHDWANPDEVKEYEHGGSFGPDLEDLQFDSETGTSLWNTTIFSQLAEQLRDAVKNARFPMKTQEYFKAIFYEKWRRSRAEYKLYIQKCEPQVLPDGSTESPADVEERLKGNRALTKRSKRRNQRRRQVRTIQVYFLL